MTSNALVAEIPIGVLGLYGSRNDSQLPPGALVTADNITYDTGGIRKEGGASKFNSSAISGTPSILAGIDYRPTASTERPVIITDDGKIFKDDGTGSFGTTLKSGITTSGMTGSFAVGGKEAAANDRKLFCFTSTNQVQVLTGDGATTADVGTPPTDWGSSFPSFGFSHEFRMWGGGNSNDPHRLYYSTTTDHGNFTGSGSGTLAIYPGEEEGLINAISFNGLIFAFKSPRGIYVANTQDSTVSNWRVDKLNGDIGMASAHAGAQVDEDFIFLDTGGNLQALSGITELGLGSRNLSQLRKMGEFVRDNVNVGRLDLCRATYYPFKRELHFALPKAGSTVNDARLVVDFNGQDIRFRFSTRDNPVSMWLQRDASGIQRPYIGDNAGFVWELDNDNRSKDGSGYKGEWKTSDMDLSHLDPSFATRRKNGKFIELSVEPTGNWDLDVDVFWDGDYHETVSFNLGTTGAALDSFILDTDALAGGTVMNLKKRITGSGRRLALQGRNDGDAQDYIISKLLLHFTPGNQRL